MQKWQGEEHRETQKRDRISEKYVKSKRQQSSSRNSLLLHPKLLVGVGETEASNSR
jgi:hypothetical protein